MTGPLMGLKQKTRMLFIEGNLAFRLLGKMCTLTLSRNYTVKYRLLNPFKKLVISSLQQISNEFSSNESCYVKFSRTEKMLDSFTRIGVKIWNLIPPSIKLFSRTKCRKVIKSSLLEDFLQSEDDYVKVPSPFY